MAKYDIGGTATAGKKRKPLISQQHHHPQQPQHACSTHSFSFGLVAVVVNLKDCNRNDIARGFERQNFPSPGKLIRQTSLFAVTLATPGVLRV